MNAKNRHIALIDDDTSALESIEFCLKNDLKQDTEIHTFSKGQKFLDELVKHDFHLVVMDLEMPNVSGFEIIQHIKSYKKSIPIVILTGNTQLLRDNPQIHKFIFEVLIKPVEYSQLLRTIKDGITCYDFYNPPKESQTSLDDTTASRKILIELVQINQELKKLLFSAQVKKNDVIRLIDSQEKLLKVLQESP